MSSEPKIVAACLESNASESQEKSASVYLDLRTEPAIRLINGRPRTEKNPAIIGLFGFADRLRILWLAAHANDPFARWWLCKVEAAIAKANAALSIHQTRIASDLRAAESMRLDVGAREVIKRIALRFACPYAFWGAQLIGALDGLLVNGDVACSIGARDRDSMQTCRRESERCIRRAFSSAHGYQSFSITDDTLSESTSVTQDAIRAMGTPPDAILDGSQWPVLLPKRRKDMSA